MIQMSQTELSNIVAQANRAGLQGQKVVQILDTTSPTGDGINQFNLVLQQYAPSGSESIYDGWN